MKTRVAAIVPAYNEAPTIEHVVSVLVSSELIDEVIVVSDGSTDETEMLAKDAGAKVFSLKENQGKGAAMLYGLQQTEAEVVLFSDADLMGLSHDHVERLLLPVISGARMMNVGLRDRGSLITPLTQHLPLISGERAMRREVIEAIPSKYLQGFMVEASMNYFCRTRGWSYGTVILSHLFIRRKHEKVGIVRAVGEYGIMSYEVVKAMVAVRLAHLLKQL